MAYHSNYQYDSSDSNRSNDKFEVVIDDPVENKESSTGESVEATVEGSSYVIPVNT